MRSSAFGRIQEALIEAGLSRLLPRLLPAKAMTGIHPDVVSLVSPHLVRIGLLIICSGVTLVTDFLEPVA